MGAGRLDATMADGTRPVRTVDVLCLLCNTRPNGGFYYGSFDQKDPFSAPVGCYWQRSAGTERSQYWSTTSTLRSCPGEAARRFLLFRCAVSAVRDSMLNLQSDTAKARWACRCWTRVLIPYAVLPLPSLPLHSHVHVFLHLACHDVTQTGPTRRIVRVCSCRQ